MAAEAALSELTDPSNPTSPISPRVPPFPPIEHHEWLLSDAVDILPSLLLPLAGPEELPEDEMERLPVDLQYLPPDKKREPEPDIRRMLLEALLLKGSEWSEDVLEGHRGLATTLMDATTDKEPLVQEQIYNALCYLGEAEPEEILHCCDEYLRQHDKLAYPHRIIILKAMETVVKNNISSLDKSTAKVVIFLASNEMTKSKEVVWEWQQAASSVLVAVGQRFINKVMEEVLTKFQPGILPHYFVMQTFANLAVSNVFGMVPFLNSILGTMLPMLGMAKQDHMKSVFCYVLGSLRTFPTQPILLSHCYVTSKKRPIPLCASMAFQDPSNPTVPWSLCQILEASVDIGSRSLDVQLDALLSTLHPQVRRAVVQVISAMAHHGYLEQPGGEAMLEFLVRQCALPSDMPQKPLPDADDHTSDSVRSISVSTLLLLSTTVDRMNNVLWPYLLEFITPVQFTNALTPVCRSLMHLSVKKQEEGGNASLIPYDLNGNLPSPHALMTRLLLLRETLAAVSDNAWICHFVTEMCRQLNGYNGFPTEKNFLYKCIGTTLGACVNKELVQKQLQELLETARYNEEAEWEGLASCFGICAINHLEETLAKLEDFVRSDVFKKSVGLFSIFKDRSDHEVEKIKSALILCYGFVAARAPRELLLSRVEADILRNISQYFSTKVLGIKVETKDLTLKLCLIRSIAMISRAVRGGTKGSDFVLGRKAELVAQMVLSDPDRTELIDACLAGVLGLPPMDPLPDCDGDGTDAPYSEELFADTFSALQELLKTLLQRSLTPHGLQDMFAHLGPWIKSGKQQERQRAVELSAALLRFYLGCLNVSSIVPFYNLGVLIALFSPRCSDAVAVVRQRAIDCVYCLLYIQLCYEGFAPDHRDEMVEGLKALKRGLEEPDFTVLFRTCTNIAMVIGKRVPPDQLMNLLLAMFEGLADPDKNCSRAATVMINALLKERGAVLQDKVPDIMSIIHSKLQEVDEEHVRKAAQQTVYILAAQHGAVVVSSLLGSALPFDSHTCAMWRALAAEPGLTAQILEQLLEKMEWDPGLGMGDVATP
ncbi:UNVERIFIED_CONTAM: hypothetical protein H355_000381 [Colinus virginianus]|nr:hypothetical protein H355_000381 [Colinus virginianus]